MQWSLNLLILMGQCSFFACHLYEYHFIERNKSWEKAQTICQRKHTDLATVFDMEDMRRLRTAMNGAHTEAWIGLYRESAPEKWHWSLPGVEFEENQTKWYQDEPTPSREEFCVWMTGESEHKWINDKCDDTQTFICYNEMDSSHKYHLIKENKTWLEAQSYCRENHTDLVSGVKQLEDKELVRELKNTSQTLWIIGLFKDTWRWSDGSSFSFRNWHRDFFNKKNTKQCAMTVPDEDKWKYDECTSTTKPFICYRDKVKLIKENKTWEDAWEYCREKHNGLVSITNLKEQRWIQERVKNASSSHVWLGLRFICTLEFWFWVSDKVVDYKNWASDRQVDDCDVSGAMERGGEYKWYKKADTNKFNFICAL